jgi:predicted trehalose synthase
MTERLAEYLRERRWFAAKSREISHADVVEEVPLPGGLRLTFVDVVFGAGTHETYQLLRAADGEEDVLDRRAGTLLELMRAGADVAGAESVVRFRALGEIPEVAGGPAGLRPMGAQQSNSSVVLGEALALKAYRRVEPGVNPDLELTRFLTEHGFEHVAALHGWYEIEGAAVNATLGQLQAYVPGRDGWSLALGELAGADGDGDRLRALGETVGEMHAVLASEPNDPAFAPEEPSQEAIGLLTATIDEEIERIFATLRDDAAVAPIAGRGEEVRDRLRMLGQVAVGGRVIRLHGDLHLGQALLAEDGRWVVLDFEGEPTRPLPERRRKRSPLRDVAGMLRSLAYAASASELQRGTPAPEGWEERAREAFLDGYFAYVDRSLLPPSDAAVRQLLSIYELEKAIYELRYEMDSRPDWVPIPVAGVLRLLDDGA